jgi:hypothetical protein
VSHGQVVRDGDGEGYRSSGWLLILGIAIVAALVSLAGHHGQTAATPAPPAPRPLPVPTPIASAAVVPPPSAVPSSSVAAAPSTPTDPTAAVLAQISGYVSVGAVCPPLTDGKTTLTVRFLLRNVTGLPEELIQVTPELSLGGLHPRGAAVQRGTCAHPTGKPTAPATNPMPPGGTLIVSLDFGLPKSCPAPYPIQAVVTVGIGGVLRMDTVALYTDLGSVKFDLCQSPAAA